MVDAQSEEPPEGTGDDEPASDAGDPNAAATSTAGADGMPGDPEATERYRDATSEAHEHQQAEQAARVREREAAERVEVQEQADRLEHLEPVEARELLLTEAALAILEDETILRLDDDQLRNYEPETISPVAAELIGAAPQDRASATDIGAIQAAAARAMSLIIGLQKQMDFEFDFATAGDAVPTRALALRAAIARAIGRVGGLGGPPFVGSFVIALRKSRSIVAEPLIDVWLAHADENERINRLLPPAGAPNRREAAEALVVLDAAGAIGGRPAMQDVLAVERALSELDLARRDAGLEPVRLVDLARIDSPTRERTATRGGLELEFERDLELRPGGP
ncbi:MAG: hypothetical protein ACOYNI_07085 [Acidimicrobiia bacterium]